MTRRRTADALIQAFATRIADGTWQPGEPIPGLRSLARLFNVARATVDAAVAEAVTRGLLVTVPRQATRVAQGGVGAAQAMLKQYRKGGAGVRAAVLIEDRPPGPTTEYFGQVAEAFCTQARNKGWTAEVVFWPVRQDCNFPRFLTDRGFDGAFCVDINPERLMPVYFMQQRGYPLVVFHQRFFTLPLPAVVFDQYGAVRRLGQMLQTLGHQRMTLIAEARQDHFNHPQITAWLDFARHSGIAEEWDEPLYLVGHTDLERALRAYFRRHPQATAVVFGSPALAAAFRDLNGEAGRVPEELSVASAFGPPGGPLSSYDPPMTHTLPNMDRMGQCAVELLARMIAGEPYPPPLRLPCDIVRTESIAPPRQ